LDGNNLQAYAGLTYIYFDLGLPEAAKLVGAQAIKRAKEIATGVFEDESTVAEEKRRRARRSRPRGRRKGRGQGGGGQGRPRKQSLEASATPPK
jgi:hypothetical protein